MDKGLDHDQEPPEQNASPKSQKLWRKTMAM